MKILGVRVLSGKKLDQIIKERPYLDYTRNDYYDKFFTHKERRFLSTVYMTIYKNTKGQLYVKFTDSLPQPMGKLYKKSELIGKTTGYNTTIISVETCYMIR